MQMSVKLLPQLASESGRSSKDEPVGRPGDMRHLPQWERAETTVFEASPLVRRGRDLYGGNERCRCWQADGFGLAVKCVEENRSVC